MRDPFRLANRESGPEPHRPDFGPAGDQVTLGNYLAAWHYWRAVRRDATLTPAEQDAYLDAAQWRLRR